MPLIVIAIWGAGAMAALVAALTLNARAREVARALDARTPPRYRVVHQEFQPELSSAPHEFVALFDAREDRCYLLELGKTTATIAAVPVTTCR